MPFRETRVDDEKLRFIADWMKGERTMSGLCASYGISREWGYRLLRRFTAEGIGGLAARSRAAHRPGHAMAEEIAAAILELRGAQPYWGPKKLRAALLRREPTRRGRRLRRSGICCAGKD